MDKLLIRGGRRLNGTVAIAGAKNAALPELCAALLVDGITTLHNVPQLQDVATMLKLLRNMGVAAERNAERPDMVTLDASRISERLSGKGNYQSITYTVEAQSRAQLDAIYRELTASGIVLVAL